MEASRSAEELGRHYGVSKHTIYAWKAKYGGMDVSEAQEVKQLRDENARLKKLVADRFWCKRWIRFWWLAGDNSRDGRWVEGTGSL